MRGKVVAELSFGFWRYLVASRYLTALWIPGGHLAFPNGPPDLRVRRREVETRLHNLMIVRNRPRITNPYIVATSLATSAMPSTSPGGYTRRARYGCRRDRICQVRQPSEVAPENAC